MVDVTGGEGNSILVLLARRDDVMLFGVLADLIRLVKLFLTGFELRLPEQSF
jgi:hypothetical protein